MHDTNSNLRFILTNNKILLSITQMIGHKLSFKRSMSAVISLITLSARASTSHSDPDKLTYKN